MQLLSITTTPLTIDDVVMSQAGLVDRQTAAADCVALWTDSPATPKPATLSSPLMDMSCPVCASPHGAR